MNKTLIASIVFIGFLIRLMGLGWGLPSKTQTFSTYHPDEAFLFQSLEHMHSTRSLHPKKIALHYGTLHFYFSGFLLLLAHLLGFLTLGSREFLLSHLDQVDRMYLLIRFFSVLCVTGSIIAVYGLIRKIFNERIALWSAFFVAVTPISITVSHFAKLDALLLPLSIFLFWASIVFLEEPSRKNAWICGILAGLIASTRYNCGILILVPMMAVWLNRDRVSLKLLIPIAAGSLVTFLVTTPYALLDFRTFYAGLEHMWTFVSSEPLTSKPASENTNSLWYVIPFGMSWIILVLSSLGLVISVRRGLSKTEKMIYAGFFSLLVIIFMSSTRYTYYLVPLLPVFSFLSAIAIEAVKDKLPRVLKILFQAAVIVFHLGSAWSLARIYSVPNPREQVGQWLEENVSAGDSVGIIRKYFWTPGVLRSENSTYQVVEGGDTQSEFNDAVVGLKNIQALPSYFVMSDVEQRNIKTLAHMRESSRESFESFLSDYELVKTFKYELTFMGVPLWLRTPPWDMHVLNPSLGIYRKKS